MSGRTFGIIPAGMAFDPDLGKVALRVGMLMAVHASKTRKCWLSTETMARLLRIDRSAVSRALAELVSRGHATRARRSIPGRGLTSSVYTLVNRPWPASEIAAEDDGEAKDEEMANPEPKGPGEPLNQSAGLGAEFTPPAPADADPVVRELHHRPRPAGADSAHTAGAETADPVVQNSHHNQYWNSISEQEEEEERAQARDASAASLPKLAVQGEEDEAVALFNESARRVGWTETQRLTEKTASLLRARLVDVGGLDGWHDAMAAFEQSNFLAKKLNSSCRRLAWLLDEDNFTNLMQGSYGPDRDPPLRGVAAVMAAWCADGRREADAPAAYTPPHVPEPEPEARQVVSPGCSRPIPIEDGLPIVMDQAIDWVATTGGHDKATIESAASGWMQRLMAAGFDDEEARAIIVYEARWVRKVRTTTGDPATMLANRIVAHAPAPSSVAA